MREKDHNPEDIGHSENVQFWGEVLPEGLLDLRPRTAELTTVQQLTGNVAPMRGDSIVAARDNLLHGMHFHERYAKSIIKSDVIGLVRRLPDGFLEHYGDKSAREVAKGKHEAASIGMGKIGDHDVVVFAMNWEHFAGSVGVVAGEKFQIASDLAISKKLPLVSIYSSSGVRQHENNAGLLQMQRLLYAQNKHKEKTDQLSVSILLGQVWGGVSASVAPKGDLVIGVPGTEYGFSGPKVIEAYEGKPVEPGAQRVESHLADRNIDAIVARDELLDYLKRILDIKASPRRNGVIPEDVKDGPVRPNNERVSDPNIERTGVRPIYTRAVPERKSGGEIPVAFGEKPTPEVLYDRYERLVRDAGHPDAEFFMRNSFDDFVPFYNSYVADKKLNYPAIISGVGRIGLQTFLVVGSQPSYQETYNGLRRIPASPAPEDFEYLMRMLDAGERWKLPAVFLGDTLGAKPTLETEKNNQMRRIGDAILRPTTYKRPVITVVTGALGSGGGLAVAPNIDHFAMLADSFAFVAEPRSATSILYATAEPKKEQIMLTLSTMSATADDQYRLNLSDETIPVSQDPYQTARNVRNSIARAMLELQGLSDRHLRGRRERRIRETEKGMRVQHSE